MYNLRKRKQSVVSERVDKQKSHQISKRSSTPTLNAGNQVVGGILNLAIDGGPSLIGESSFKAVEREVKCKVVPDEICVICRDNLSQNESCTAKPCGHSFHVTCASEWWHASRSCAMCRQTVKIITFRNNAPDVDFEWIVKNRFMAVVNKRNGS